VHLSTRGVDYDVAVPINSVDEQSFILRLSRLAGWVDAFTWITSGGGKVVYYSRWSPVGGGVSKSEKLT